MGCAMNPASELPPATRSRLTKLLGMLGSDHQGERDNAALAAHKLVKQHGLTWEAVVMPPRAREPLMGIWRATVAACLERPGSLRPWEAGFLRDLSRFRRLSTKQRYVLEEISGRVLQGGAP